MHPVVGGAMTTWIEQILTGQYGKSQWAMAWVLIGTALGNLIGLLVMILMWVR